MNVSYSNKHEGRFHHRLSNGQHCTFFVKYEECLNPEIEIVDVAFVVANSKRKCNNWWIKDGIGLGDKITGKCGLEALLFAIKCLDFIENLYKDQMIVIRIMPTDEKRKSAYRRLLKRGYLFIEGEGYAKVMNDLIYYQKLGGNNNEIS